VDFPRTRALVESAIGTRVSPAVSLEVGRTAGASWGVAAGALTYDDAALPCTAETIFDLASLTKVIATTSCALGAIQRGSLSLDTRVANILPYWQWSDRDDVRVWHLLTHSSGLPASTRLWDRAHGRAGYEPMLSELPLERAPGEASVYSDPGFMLLGFLLDDLTDGLDATAAWISEACGESLSYLPDESERPRIAPTEFDPWRGRLLQGEVHDENAAALGGIAGHAGVFGTAAAVGAFARLVLRTFVEPTALATPELMREFATRCAIPRSSRALGWDTMLPTSSCGTRLSPTAIGHTGFTGTSLWIDWERDLYVVLLTNRVYPTRQHNALAALRPRVHDAVVEDATDAGFFS
jgi:CubicO group peptidase (beta-lactamase class C family)